MSSRLNAVIGIVVFAVIVYYMLRMAGIGNLPLYPWQMVFKPKSKP